MDFNKVTQGKAVPLGIIIIIITYLISGSSSSILPFIFITGILVGIMKNEEVAESTVAAFLSTLIGAVVATVISLIMMYMSYGPIYFTYMLYSSLYSLVFYIIAGTIGGVIGYYVYQELDIKK
ncbi:DUF5518 domain-containing protein [Candidatus Methanosphaera massiliense]|jgi:hypothetical protein|uniref:DUF5518 domain-containing protein n=1 Tax=Methanosphaera TaxID=2316 RepID=UPI00237FDA6C|nr:DUF5518 domain-containing protein [Candidatus Methanosphaera massiliense]MDD6286098.1 DUF5518 domain-containing protein [Methanobacteriaceae archaeon]MDE4077737.1 DUF5518 domain-containing protein [Candidatus Methanosphaera massiliense]MDY2745385.1 DUF5518 domain-containing protein [Methanosphaera sp.]